MDWFRLRELEARMKRGQDELTAWEHVARHRKFGLGIYRGARKVPTMVVARSLARFYFRIGVIQCDLAVARVRRRANEAAPGAMDSIIDIASGDFGEAKVRVKGKEEVLEIDAAAAKTRLAACREILEMVGAVAPRGASQSQAAVQVNTNVAAVAQGGHVTLGAAIRQLRHHDVEAEFAPPPASE